MRFKIYWVLKLCANSPELYSDTVSAIYVPEGFDSNKLTDHAFNAYGVSFGIGLGEMNGKAFRIGHLGDCNDLTLMATLAGCEMGLQMAGVKLNGSGIAAAMDFIGSQDVPFRR